jgi:hypothetical protein
VKLNESIRREIDAEGVVRDEFASVNRLLPPRWADMALRDSVTEVAKWFKTAAGRDFQVGQEDVILARKRGRGGRPLALLGLTERLVYRACVSLVERERPAASRSSERYAQFLQEPLSADGCEYVFKTDIAAYYQYVDHERLIDEVVAQTGDDLAISAAVELLQASSGRSFGLPQLSLVSDVLADIYIDPMGRRLSRAGFTVSRFADDFRVACTSYPEALEVWEEADRAARDLGLVLNESKTSTPRRETYEASLDAVANREVELFDDLEVEVLVEPDLYEDVVFAIPVQGPTTLSSEPDFDEADMSPNGGSDDLEPVTEAQVAAARKVVEVWLDEEEDEDTQRQDTARVTTVLLRRALRILTAAKDPSALGHITYMYVYEASLTPTISSYLQACATDARAAVVRALNDVCKSNVAGPWQQMWLAFVAGAMPGRRVGTNPPRYLRWLVAQIESTHAGVAAEAAVALARRGLVQPDEIDRVIRRMPAAHRLTAVMALGALGDEERAVKATDSAVDKLVVKWALEHLA